MKLSLFAALIAACVLLPACDDADNAASIDATAPDADTDMGDPEAPLPLTRGSRYCEVLLVRMGRGILTAEAWGTQGLSDCPAADWEALDADVIKAETGASLVKLNGPRYWLPNMTTEVAPAADRRLFGQLEMRLLATLELDPNARGQTHYIERTARRTSDFTFDAGERVYDLTAPNGSVYVMQAYAQIVDATLTEPDLTDLGARLALPEGWGYSTRVLDEALVAIADGEAIVVLDELENAYQRVIVGAE
ncbi:MAG: hypothetical protein ACI9U2_004938 [Bradymonadia bacterium]|jgi:hypothetical protein